LNAGLLAKSVSWAIMGIVYGLLIELLTSIVFKSKPV
jgi:K+-transporting ATPase c subunit